MPMFKALEACPEAVVIPPDMEKYVRVGREVRAMMQALTPLVEPLSIDEAFLDLSGTEQLQGVAASHGARATSPRNVQKEIGITASRPAFPTASSWPRSRPTSASRAASR